MDSQKENKPLGFFIDFGMTQQSMGCWNLSCSIHFRPFLTYITENHILLFQFPKSLFGSFSTLVSDIGAHITSMYYFLATCFKLHVFQQLKLTNKEASTVLCSVVKHARRGDSTKEVWGEGGGGDTTRYNYQVRYL